MPELSDDGLRDEILSLWENDQRGVVGSSTYHQEPADMPQERRGQVRRAFLAKGWNRRQRRLFLLRMLRDRVLSEEALAGGRDETDIRMFLSWTEPLRYPENYPFEENTR